METDGNYPAQFKNVIEKIIDAELNKRGITKYISALVKGINDDGTVNVCIPPNLDSIISGLLNKTGETLSEGDSVELCAKNGSVNNSWVAIKHKTNNSGGGTEDHAKLTNLDYANSGHVGFAGTNVSNTFSQEQRFNSNIIGDSNANIAGDVQGRKGFWSRNAGEVNTPIGSGCLQIKQASYTEAPNNGVVLEYGNSTFWTGQLFFADNSYDGVWFNGWDNGTRGTWKKLAFEDDVQTKSIELYNNTSGTNASLTLSDSSANYEYIEIFFRDNDGNYNSIKIYQPNGKNASLISQYNNGGTTVWFKIAIVAISGTSITFGNCEEVKLVHGSSIQASKATNIYITRVVGYK